MDPKLVKWIKTGVTLVVIVVVLIIASSKLFYLWKSVDQAEVGIKFRGGAITEIVGPGVHSDFAYLAKMELIDVSGLPFSASDEEVITSDKQRLGLQVSGTVHRPGLEKADILLSNWSDYKTFYTEDAALIGIADKNGVVTQDGLMQRLSKQAMKVCIGDRTFDQSVIGSSRDELRSCIETELTKLVANFGLDVKNIVIPNIIISEEVKNQMDAITLARLSVEKAKQETLQVYEEANKKVAQEQGLIRVAAGQQQEQARQDAITADLKKTALEKQLLVIEAQKANDLISAERDLQIQQAVNLAAQEAAKAKTAEQLAVATLFQNNPIYAAYMRFVASIDAFKITDKVFFLQEGLDPTLLFGNGIVPTIDIR